jgi:ATP-binding cassette subfamily B protein
MKIVQLFNLQNRERKKFRDISRETFAASMGEVYVFATFRPLIDLLSTMTVAVLLWAGAYLAGIQTVSLGVIAAAVSLVQKFYEPVKDLAEKFNITQSAAAGIAKINEILVAGNEEEKTDDTQDGESGVETVFRGVFFSYKAGEPVLKDVSFEIPQGKTVAIVGYTGSGKTTVASLLTRIRDRDSGFIGINGKDIRDWSLGALRKTILPVSQDVVLFEGTIRENIAFGDEYSDDEIEKACRLVQAHDFISELPGAYNYRIKENGSNISMGQRQLLAFARAIIRSPGMIILDEASSHIDSGTEAQIEKGISGLLRGRTALVIAHRLSTVRKADNIIVLSGGRIAEQGTHEELLGKKGLYYSFYRLQFVDGD